MERIAFNIGPINIYWYSICILVGIATALFLIFREAKKQKIDEEFLINLAFRTIILGVIGARLYYVIFNFPYYINNPLEIKT